MKTRGDMYRLASYDDLAFKCCLYDYFYMGSQIVYFCVFDVLEVSCSEVYFCSSPKLILSCTLWVQDLLFRFHSPPPVVVLSLVCLIRLYLSIFSFVLFDFGGIVLCFWEEVGSVICTFFFKVSGFFYIHCIVISLRAVVIVVRCE